MTLIKTELFFLYMFFIPISVIAQTSLKKEYNMFRNEDIVTKQQIKYKHPGRAGANVLWDFSKQETVNEKYKLSFTQSEVDSVITGCEHNTLYHYLLRNDSLYSLGYENPTTLIKNQKPELLLTFPFSYHKRTEGYFYGTGNYCHRLDLTVQGKTIIWGDAYGMIILPNGDTLQHVLRVCSLKKIAEKMIPYVQKDSVILPMVNIDSIDYHLNNDSVYMQVETYRWYADGYRYPLFETVESTTYKNQKPFKHFNTAFFYSPDKHNYLNDDSKNLVRLEEIEKQNKSGNNSSGGNGNSSGKNLGKELINYNAYIEKNGNSIALEYNLIQQADVTISLYDIQGRLLISYPKTKHPEGFYQEALALDGFQLGEYLLRIVVDDEVYAEKLLNKKIID
ncbi:T9SS type A sorting domain-containing protein [uncultured Bacteroides sp.]|uniref:T9SS type A sorting domain-containing protein n=1 Tax=uncultured Bacteroides sp. TaxID=162156 RepID=UPI002AAB6F9E|nr:T9SS type A sorting domain-containing protein [uncultured Bacteroides sp.]